MNETRKNEELDSRELLIERLKEQKEKNYRHYLEAGFEFGKSSAETLNFCEFKELEKSHLSALQNPNLRGWEPRIIQNSSIWQKWVCDEIQDLADEDFEFNYDAYLIGLLNGLIKVWDQIKDQI